MPHHQDWVCTLIHHKSWWIPPWYPSRLLTSMHFQVFLWLDSVKCIHTYHVIGTRIGSLSQCKSQISYLKILVMNHFRTGMKIYKMLFSLCEIQRLAYQPDDKRCSRDVLHFYLKATTFLTGYCEMFPPNNLKKIKTRAMYGNPFHSLVAHMADMYRIVSLRSIVTEGCERTFLEYRYVWYRLLCIEIITWTCLRWFTYHRQSNITLKYLPSSQTDDAIGYQFGK